MTILDDIIAFKRTEVHELKIQVPFRKLELSESDHVALMGFCKNTGSLVYTRTGRTLR